MPTGVYDRSKARNAVGGGTPETPKRKKTREPRARPAEPAAEPATDMTFFAVVETRLGQRPRILAIYGDGGEAIKLHERLEARPATADGGTYHLVSGQLLDTAAEVIATLPPPAAAPSPLPAVADRSGEAHG